MSSRQFTRAEMLIAQVTPGLFVAIIFALQEG